MKKVKQLAGVYILVMFGLLSGLSIFNYNVVLKQAAEIRQLKLDNIDLTWRLESIQDEIDLNAQARIELEDTIAQAQQMQAQGCNSQDIAKELIPAVLKALF
jgi:hypothetical protein